MVRAGRAEELARRQNRLGATPYFFETRTGDEDADESGGSERHEAFEERALGGIVAPTLAQLREERTEVEALLARARRRADEGEDSKFEKLRGVRPDQSVAREKFIVFTEYRDTAEFLVHSLEGLGFTGQVALIHGGLDYREREAQVELFRRPLDDGGANCLVATDAAGEGNQPAVLLADGELRRVVETGPPRAGNDGCRRELGHRRYRRPADGRAGARARQPEAGAVRGRRRQEQPARAAGGRRPGTVPPTAAGLRPAVRLGGGASDRSARRWRPRRRLPARLRAAARPGSGARRHGDLSRPRARALHRLPAQHLWRTSSSFWLAPAGADVAEAVRIAAGLVRGDRGGRLRVLPRRPFLFRDSREDHNLVAVRKKP